MRYLRFVVAALALSGCAADSAPTPPAARAPDNASPVPRPSAGVFLWGMVVDNSGLCISGATVRVVRGQALGRESAQQTPCGAWDYGGGFLFDGLSPDVEMTIRVSAPGYVAMETTVIPTSGPQTALLIAPSPE